MTLSVSNLSRLEAISPKPGLPISDEEWKRLRETYHVCLLLDELGIAV